MAVQDDQSLAQDTQDRALEAKGSDDEARAGEAEVGPMYTSWGPGAPNPGSTKTGADGGLSSGALRGGLSGPALQPAPGLASPSSTTGFHGSFTIVSWAGESWGVWELVFVYHLIHMMTISGPSGLNTGVVCKHARGETSGHTRQEREKVTATETQHSRKLILTPPSVVFMGM